MWHLTRGEENSHVFASNAFLNAAQGTMAFFAITPHCWCTFTLVFSIFRSFSTKIFFFPIWWLAHSWCTELFLPKVQLHTIHTTACLLIQPIFHGQQLIQGSYRKQCVQSYWNWGDSTYHSSLPTHFSIDDQPWFHVCESIPTNLNHLLFFRVCKMVSRISCFLDSLGNEVIASLLFLSFLNLLKTGATHAIF